MVRKDGRFILQEGRNSLSFHTKKLIKSRSNVDDRCTESFKTYNREMGLICRPGYKSVVEESEFAETMRKEELLDHDNCIWLSSSSALSPSSCFEHDSLFSYTDLKIDAWYISLLSTPSIKSSTLLSTKVTFFDGSRVNPMEEAYLVLDQQKVLDENVAFQENLEEKEVVSWLSTSTENESKLAYFENDFSTPVSVSSITDSSDEYSSFSSSSNSDYSSDIVDLEEFGADTPLFWPFNWEFDCGSGTKWDTFIMSPRKKLYKVDNSPKNTSGTISPKVLNGDSDSEKGCSKSLVFGTHSKSSDYLDEKETYGIKNIRKTRSNPSRLRKSTKSSTKIVALCNENHFEELKEVKGAYESESTNNLEIFTDPHNISDKNSELRCTQSISVTPVCKSLQVCASSVYSPSDMTDTSDLASKNEAFEDSRTKTPIFWPSSCASEWGSDTKWDFFLMSPRKDIYNICRSPKMSPDTLRHQVLNGNMDVEKGCNRRLEFRNDSKSTKTVTTEKMGVEALTKKTVSKHKIVLEDLLLVDKLNVDGSIEEVLGLCEFDGHEDIDS